MNGKPTDWGTASGQLNQLRKRQKQVREVGAFLIAAVLVALFFVAIACSPAEAARRFVQKSSECANGQCNIQKQQAVVQQVHHVQQVVAQPVVHHAAVVAQPVCAGPVVHQAVAVPGVHTQNNWYQVGTEAVMEAVATKAARNVMAEQQFKAQVSGTFQGSINGSAQALYQQQAAPVQQWQQPSQPQQPQWTPPPEPQPPAEPDAPPTFSALDANCAGCHANGKAKGGFSLDGMTGDQFWAAVDRVRDGTMPPTNPLADAAKEAVVKELFTLKP